ncbi:Uu.00g001730.m01.CDS01 [Anthostomella pinea]|uniref:Uu.00g001730.m01.CDS01 n=1 Tax=Anthostomella pinea TaxID=933095 RepID=A0AAI8YG49_9PEZI|nr:Uu.00g001730.m01.CDS01 [Anthostomella pinea]
MAVDALTPNDPRVEHKYASVGGYTYHYMLAKPEGTPTATIFLIHGWPDLAMGWRFQVPFLLSLGLQVVVPDMLGYGQTSAPDAPEEYTFKKMTGHMAAIIKEVTDQPIILGGHDWGGFFIWRMTNYYPELIRAVFSICVPYMPPTPVKISLEQFAEKMPNFRYQLHLASGEAEKMIDKSTERLRGFLNGMYGGTTADGGRVFSTDTGIIEENLDKIRPSPLVGAAMVEHYVREYSRNGLHGPCNWYRTRELNADDEVPIAGDDRFKRFAMPAMLIMAELDAALPPWLADGQEKYFEGGLKKEVIPGASHWAMVQKPEDTNSFIGEFVKSVLDGDSKASL